jgi:hypothetical protein
MGAGRHPFEGVVSTSGPLVVRVSTAIFGAPGPLCRAQKKIDPRALGQTIEIETIFEAAPNYPTLSRERRRKKRSTPTPHQRRSRFLIVCRASGVRMLDSTSLPRGRRARGY